MLGKSISHLYKMYWWMLLRGSVGTHKAARGVQMKKQKWEKAETKAN